MTRPNLETELINALNDLTPAERQTLAAATPAEWAKAGAEVLNDPAFWGEIAAAFAEGFTRGFENRR